MRPTNFNEIIGQEDIIEYLNVKIKHSLANGEPLGHTLLLGFPGSGKTTFANVIANELKCTFHSVMASRISSFNDFVSFFDKLKKRDVLFIDEIHALKPRIQEELYDSMEDFQCDIRIGDSFVKKQINKYTLIGATTHQGDLNAPLLSRFAYKPVLMPYTIEQLQTIINNYSNRLWNITIPEPLVTRIAHLSKRTARTACTLTKSFVEYSSAINSEEFTSNKLNRLLQLEGLDPIIGQDRVARKYCVAVLKEKKAIGIKPLCSMINEQETTITQLVEPFLLTDIELDFTIQNERVKLIGPLIKLTKQGRVPTEICKKYIDICIVLQKNGWFKEEKLTY